MLSVFYVDLFSFLQNRKKSQAIKFVSEGAGFVPDLFKI